MSDDMPEVSKRFAPAPMRGRSVYLRHLTADDYRTLQQVDSGEVALRWRSRGATPSPDQWMQLMWSSVLAQFGVARTSDRKLLGTVMVYRPNFQDDHAYFAAMAVARRRSPLMILGCALFLEYVFTCWSFHKLYMEVPEYNMGQISSGVGRYFQLEGRLRGHLFYDGQRWDEVTLALYRDDWKVHGRRVLATQHAAHVRPRIESLRGWPGASERR